MAPLVLEGDTLGQKHKHFNRLVKEAISSNSGVVKIDYDVSDVDNLLQIDLASHNRDVEYIVEVLRCEDMLYVSRALKQATWLITDVQYAHIINPEYLHTRLFPQMTSKAINKLMLKIRLLLKDETRVDEFFNYCKERKSFKTALKWLPNCSVTLIENTVKSPEFLDDMSDNLLKRLCEKSITVLEAYYKAHVTHWRYSMTATQFMLKRNVEKYLAIVEALPSYNRPKFGKKQTSFIVKTCPERIHNKFDMYCNLIDLETFVKHLKPDEIKGFLIKQLENPEMKNWFSYSKVKHFIKYMPVEGRFDFLKQTFIDKITEDTVVPCDSNNSRLGMMLCSAVLNDGGCRGATSNSNIYRWYIFAPFDTAFKDLINLIRIESNPYERLDILKILMDCARRNPQNIRCVLEYYHKKHINESFKFKVQVVNNLISRSKVYEYDDQSWKLLNDLFYSMEVYSESDNNVSFCVNSIILYKVLNDQNVPEIIEKKFNFDSFKTYHKKLSNEQKEKVFSYLYNFMLKKIQSHEVRTTSTLEEGVTYLKTIMTLLIDWKKDISEYPIVIKKIKEYVNMNEQNSWNVDFLGLYNLNKSWKRYMFEESLSINPSEEVCLNILKHDIGMLSRHEKVVQKISTNNSFTLRRLLNKLRIYWEPSLAAAWTAAYRSRLDNLSYHQSVVRGLFLLFPRKQMVEFIEQYVPKEEKINWSEENEKELSLVKYIARNMYIARPLLPATVVLKYMKGDYLQYVIPSLSSILYDLSSSRCENIIPLLLNAPISIQKHGVRLAFAKFDGQQIQQVILDIWKSSKNASIRAVIFKETFDLLCRTKEEVAANEIWSILKMLIDNLSQEENKSIYGLLSAASKIPISVRPDFCVKSYKFLKTLPPKTNCDLFCTKLEKAMIELMEHIDSDFAASIILDNVQKSLKKNESPDMYMIVVYLLYTKDELIQIDRYNKVILPILKLYTDLWNKVDVHGYYITKEYFFTIINYLFANLEGYTLDKKYVIPVAIMTRMLKTLEETLPVQENYVMLRSLKIFLDFITVLEPHAQEEWENVDSDSTNNDPDASKWRKCYLKAIPEFSKRVVQILKQDLQEYYSSIYVLFDSALSNVLEKLARDDEVRLELYISILDENIKETYLISIMHTSMFLYTDESKAKKAELINKLHEHSSDEVKMHLIKTLTRF